MDSKLVRSIFKENLKLSVALLLLNAVVFMFLFVTLFLLPSLKKTFNCFIEGYGVSDCIVVLDNPDASFTDKLLSIEGIRAVDDKMIAEAQTVLADGSIYSCRYISVSDDESYSYYDPVKATDILDVTGRIMISCDFAKSAGVFVGDRLYVRYMDMEIPITVTDMVSCPETIAIVRDNSSWADKSQYGYIFVDEALLSMVTDTDLSNRFDIYFEESADEKMVMSEVEDLVGERAAVIMSRDKFPMYMQIDISLLLFESITTIWPVSFAAIGLVFCIVFTGQLVRHSQKKIGLLKSLGMSNLRITLVFERFNFYLCTIAVVIGTLSVIPIFKWIISLYKDFYYIPDIQLEISPLRFLLAVGLLYIIGLISVFVCSRNISNVDPVYTLTGKNKTVKAKAPEFITRLRLKPMIKVTICSVWRHKRRFFVMVVSDIASLLIFLVSIGIVINNIYESRYIFSQRYISDYMVVSSDEELLDKVASQPYVIASEKGTNYSTYYEDELTKLIALPKKPQLTGVKDTEGNDLQVPEDGILLEEGFAYRYGFEIGDYIELGGLSLEVKGITRQYMNTEQIISVKTAKMLGKETDTLFVKLDEGCLDEEFRNNMADMGISCVISMEIRKEDIMYTYKLSNIPMYIVILLGCFMGIDILSNMSIIFAQLRKKIFATYSVLGTPAKKVYESIIAETIMHYVTALIPGIPLCVYIARFFYNKMTNIGQTFIWMKGVTVVLLSALLLALCLVVSVFFTIRAVRKMDPIEILGSHE